MTPNAIRLLKFAHWIDIDESLRFDVSNSSKHYISKGIIYTNGNHFTSRFIDENFNI